MFFVTAEAVHSQESGGPRAHVLHQSLPSFTFDRVCPSTVAPGT